MAYQTIQGVRVWGIPDESAVKQMATCARTPGVGGTALMADHHKGYSQPIGGVIAYRGLISPSGVGYDIACGNKAVQTDLQAADVMADLERIMDAIVKTISFGVGRKNPEPVDHELFDDPTWKDIPEVGRLKQLAHQQLGTVGSGNHFVDLMVDEKTGLLWVAVHFGSRGFGHKTASGFLNLAAGRPFDAQAPGEHMDQEPTVLRLDSDLGQAYYAAMQLAGRYAYAGRDHVAGQVLKILGARATFAVHNHHNFAWLEEHEGEQVMVVRKGATPNWPGQASFVGGSMGDISVVVRGKGGPEAQAALHSTVHGAGRVMSRMAAAGKWKRVGGRRVRVGGKVSREAMLQAIGRLGVVLRGAGTDEAPQVYRPLQQVLDAHRETLEILHVLRPIGVAMAGEDEYDPYKD